MNFSRSIHLRISNRLVVVPVVGCIGIIIFCLYYLCNSYRELAGKYQFAHGCFYRHAQWKTKFFTDAIKIAGNWYCVCGIITSLALLMYYLNRRRQSFQVLHDDSIRIHFNGVDVISMVGLLLLGAGLWAWGFVHSVPAYDEVFSAINCAGEGPVLSVTYYMLPNNHVLFNIINSSLFWCSQDNIVSGRIISGVAFITLIVLLYNWLRSKLDHRGYAVLYCAVVMLQFPVWGFSFQARGYSLYLLCAWTSLIMLEYYLDRHNTTALIVHAFTCIIGFAVMPTFLFWYSSIALIIGCNFVYNKRVDRKLIIWHIIILASVFLFYLPILCYSGLSALTDNEYVRVAHPSWPDFWNNFKSGFDATIRYCFASDVDGHSLIYPILFAAPMLLLPFLRGTRASLYIICGLTIWAVFLMLQMKFRHYPFMRNMIAHCSVSLAILMISIHFFSKKVFGKTRLSFIQHAAPLLFCLLSMVHFVRYMYGNLNGGLYFYDTVGRYNDQLRMIKGIPKGAAVWTSDESFFPRYLLLQAGTHACNCYNGQRFFIVDKTLGEQPPILVSDLKCIDSANQYLVYHAK